MRRDAGVTPGGISVRTRQVTKIVLVLLVVVIGGFITINGSMERRTIQYESAEEIYGQLEAGGFLCRDPYFPTGNSEPTGFSRVSCERGFITIDIGVNQERGRWLNDKSEPYDGSGTAVLKGTNWWVAFPGPSARSLSLATDAQEILGGRIVEDLPQSDP